MRPRPTPIVDYHVQPLESRRLMSSIRLIDVEAPFTGETRVPFSGDAHLHVDVAAADNGSHLVVGEVRDGSTRSITAVRYSHGGEQVGAPVVLYTYTPAEPFPVDGRVAAAMDADGDAVVAFSVLDDVPGRNNARTHKVFFTQISNAGNIGAPTLVDERPWSNNPLPPPSVAMADDGEFLVGWLAFWPREQESRAQIRAYDSAGAPRAPVFAAATASGMDGFSSLELAATPDGSGAVFAVTNVHLLDDVPFTQYSVGVGRVSTSAAIGGLTGVGTDRNPFLPSIATYADGSFIVGYGEPFTTKGKGYVQRFSASAQPQGEPIELGASLEDNDATHAVAVDVVPDGGFVAAFMRSQGNLINKRYAARYDAAGQADEPLTHIGTHWNDLGSPFDQSATAVATDAAGTAVLAWSTGLATLRRFAPDATFNDGKLHVLGTAGDDAISVKADELSVTVTRGAIVQTFDAAQVAMLSIDGFGGNDRIVNFTRLPATIQGGDGDDVIVGGAGGDSIMGGDGYDRIDGGADADVIDGGEGRDWIRGQGGNDTIRGSGWGDFLNGDEGDDSINGGGFYDHIDGGAGNDILSGDDGRDWIRGEDGDDTIFGGAWGDFLTGGSGNDRIFGGGFQDVIDGGPGADTLDGGAGNDRFFAMDSKPDVIRGGPGADTAEVDDEDDVLEVETIG